MNIQGKMDILSDGSKSCRQFLGYVPVIIDKNARPSTSIALDPYSELTATLSFSNTFLSPHFEGVFNVFGKHSSCSEPALQEMMEYFGSEKSEEETKMV